MRRRILVTGGAGSIGTALGAALNKKGADFTVLDLRARGDGRGDIRDREAVRCAIDGCSGVIHLAAVSRVAWAEQAPDACRSTNVLGTKNLLAAAAELPHRPWMLFVSSREIYGEPEELPVAEDARRVPINAYGRSKAEAEDLVEQADHGGLTTAIVRLSNVYGATHDHADRVVPAFIRGALDATTLDVAGAHRTFDFTHVDDVVRGLCRVADMLDAGERLPPIHLVTGAGVTLGELARTVVALSGSRSAVRERPACSHDVSRFVGDPRRARALTGFEAGISLHEGLGRLLSKWRAQQGEEASAS